MTAGVVAGGNLDGGAQCSIVTGKNGQRHGDLRTARFRLVDQNGASVTESNGTDQRKTQTDTVSAILNAGLPQIAEEGGIQHIRRETLAVILQREFQNVAAAGQLGIQRIALVGILGGIGNHVQNGPFQHVSVSHTHDNLRKRCIMQLDLGHSKCGSCLFHDFGKYFGQNSRLHEQRGFCIIPNQICHVADLTVHSVQAVFHLRLQIRFQTFGDSEQHVQGLAQLLCSQRKCLPGSVSQLFQKEQIAVLQFGNGGAVGQIQNTDGHEQTAVCKRLISFRTLQKIIFNTVADFDKALQGAFIGFHNDAIPDTERRAVQQLQQSLGVAWTIHDLPPRRIGCAFYGKTFKKISTDCCSIFIVANSDKNSKDKYTRGETMSEESGIHQGHRKRLKERFLTEGLDNFNEVNVLELMLFYCVQRQDTNPLAHRLLDHFGKLSCVLDASPEELMKVSGVTEHIATYLTMVNAVGRFYLRNRMADTKILTTTEACGKYMMPYFHALQNETVYLLCLDAKCKVLACKKVGEGSVNSASISIRRIVETALNANAVSVVLAHNHPSGLALPSAEDVQTTLRLARALHAVEITLADHLVVADGDFVSMVQSGKFNPTDCRTYF